MGMTTKRLAAGLLVVSALVVIAGVALLSIPAAIVLTGLAGGAVAIDELRSK